jgi:uncharacterized repeat protein (TIGR01451 family)
MGSGSDDFDARISGLRSDTTYFFRAVAENDEGTDEGSILSFRTDDDNNNNNGDQPTVTTRSATDVSTSSATLRGEVDGNDSDTEVWFEWGRDRSDLSEETSREDTGSGSEEFDKHISGLRSDTTYYFRAMAENDEGTDEGSILSFRTDNSGNNSNDEGNITAVTTPATPVFSTSASLNSLILNPDNSSADAWFEWGTTLGLGNQTNRVPIGSSDSVRHTDTLTGLRAGTLYYFRAVAENSSERSVGSTLSFVTSGANIVQNPTTIVRNVTTVVNNGTGRNSLVTLTIDGGSEFITTNESREYHVTWKNISSQTLKNVVVRVLLPRSMTFAAASDGTFSDSDNALAFDIGTLSPNESGDLTLLARTGSILKDGELLVVVADLVYTNPAGVQDDVLAYATHKVYLPGSVLGASVFGAGFLPNSLFGWLLLLILLLILVLLIRYLSNPREVQRPVYTNTPPPPPSYL